MSRWLLFLLVLVTAAPAMGAAENRYPQPIAAGALAGRKLIAPVEAQPLLGRVEAVERGADGALALRVRLGWWGGRAVQVPLAAVALLGPEVALLDLTPAQLEALPDAPASTSLPGSETIQIGLVKPFH